MSSPRIGMVDVPAPPPLCGGSGQPTPPLPHPRGARLRAGRCPVCGRLYGRHPRTGTMHPHQAPDPPAGARLLPNRRSGADTPLSVVASEEPDEPATVPTGIVACHECTILIGPGYLEPEPFPHPHRAGVVCGACLASLTRRTRRATPFGSAAQRFH